MHLRIMLVLGICGFVILWCEIQLLTRKCATSLRFPESEMPVVSDQRMSFQANNIKLVEISGEFPQSTRIPRIVHYLWCSEKSFRFNNYLSVLSSVRYLNPDRVTFHYNSLPEPEKFNYYDNWFEELLRGLSLFNPTPVSYADVCNTSETMRQYVADVLRSEGGIYVEESTVFTEDMDRLFHGTLKIELGYDGTGYAAAAPKQFKSRNLVLSKTKQPCPSCEDLSKIRSCFSVRKRVYPKTFWSRRDLVSRTVNTLLYGSEKTPKPKRYDYKVIPNIGHVLWLRGKPVDYMFYLSCLSLVYVAKVDTLFVHGDVEPSGRYWNELKNITNFRFVKIVVPNRVFNFTIKRLSHMSDIFRATVLWKYGGIYSDVDVIWTQPINDELFRHDAVASFDWAHAYFPYPDYLNLGVSMGRRGAPFWQEIISSFDDFRDGVFGYNGLLKPYKVYERNPGLLFLYDRIQTMCFKERCYPRWNTTETYINWSTDTYSYHWTWPTPVEFHNQSILLKSNSTWAEIGKNVLIKAGVI